MMRAHFASADRLAKVIIVGDSNVGKTTMLRTLTREPHSANAESTVGVDFGYSLHEVRPAGAGVGARRRVKLQIWDTAGQERFRSLTQAYYARANAVLLVYDASRPESARSLRRHYEEARAALREHELPGLIWCVVGAKADLIDIDRAAAASTDDGNDNGNDDGDLGELTVVSERSSCVVSERSSCVVSSAPGGDPVARRMSATIDEVYRLVCAIDGTVLTSTIDAYNAQQVLGVFDRVAYEVDASATTAEAAAEASAASAAAGEDDVEEVVARERDDLAAAATAFRRIGAHVRLPHQRRSHGAAADAADRGACCGAA
jgi:small GTP-binding protein